MYFDNTNSTVIVDPLQGFNKSVEDPSGAISTLQEHQAILTNVTIFKISDMFLCNGGH